MRRFSLLSLTLFALSAFLSCGPALAQGLVVTPNCGAPGDTIRVKSGGWPKMFPTLGYGSALDCAWGGQDTLLAHGSGLTAFDRVYVVPDWAEVGDRPFGLVQCTCLNSDCSECQSTPADSKFVSFRVVANVGHPWLVSTATVDTLIQMRMTFDPSTWCNTSPCSRIRIIQVLHLLGLKSGQYVPLSYAGRFLDPVAKEATRVDDHCVDAWGLVVNLIPAEYDPYVNGEVDFMDKRSRRTKGWNWGQMGTVLKQAFYSDAPDFHHYGDSLTSIRCEFETNAFCSDGPNQGEYLGRITWVWEKPVGQTPTITHAEGVQQPTPAFLKAVAKFNEVRGFNMPPIALPTTGGSPTCPP